MENTKIRQCLGHAAFGWRVWLTSENKPLSHICYNAYRSTSKRAGIQGNIQNWGALWLRPLETRGVAESLNTRHLPMCVTRSIFWSFCVTMILSQVLT